jgi:hypothetical protein
MKSVSILVLSPNLRCLSRSIPTAPNVEPSLISKFPRVLDLVSVPDRSKVLVSMSQHTPFAEYTMEEPSLGPGGPSKVSAGQAPAEGVVMRAS